LTKDNKVDEELEPALQIIQDQQADEKNLICSINREKSCNLFCRAKEDIIIYDAETKILGIIKEPQTTFKNKKFIINNGDSDIYMIDANYLQMGICWRNSLYGRCNKCVFPIQAMKSGKVLSEKIGTLTKMYINCNTNLVDYEIVDPDSMEIIFPDNSTSIEKLLLTLCGLVIEYRFYEICPRNE
jgi:hypothetical protein